MTDKYDCEKGYWGNCTNTFAEETKQYVYARLMGIRREHYSFRVYGASIIDIGGGPTSMLLKCHDLGRHAVVVDPIQYPQWTLQRYLTKGVMPITGPGELLPVLLQGLGALNAGVYDEAWIYNVLQHVDDPELVVRNALAVCKKLRIFDWINIPPYQGHPHMLLRDKLDQWLGTKGDVVPLSYECCWGEGYCAVVEGKAK